VPMKAVRDGRHQAITSQILVHFKFSANALYLEYRLFDLCNSFTILDLIVPKSAALI